MSGRGEIGLGHNCIILNLTKSVLYSKGRRYPAQTTAESQADIDSVEEAECEAATVSQIITSQ